MSEIRVWVDGAIVDPDEPSVRAVDHGVTVGDGVFETCKIVGGAVFARTRHWRRLGQSLAGLGLPPADEAAIDAGIEAVLTAGPLIALGRLRYTVTGGAGPLGSDRAGSPLTHIVTAGPIPPPPASTAICTVPWTRNERAASAGLKTTSYVDNVIALARAKEHDASEAIFANTRGELCEGTGTNIFVVLGGVLHTPPLSSGCLAGITRELVLEWCRDDGLEVREEPLPLGVLGRCDEVFITSTTRDVMPVHRVDDRLLEPGEVTARAAEVFRRRADVVDP